MCVCVCVHIGIMCEVNFFAQIVFITLVPVLFIIIDYNEFVAEYFDHIKFF